MELFDIVKSVFKSDKEWNKVSRNDKVRNFFMTNRIMSIQFPIQANQFNHTKVLPRPVSDWWHDTLSKYYTKMPGWIFTKTKKSKKKKVTTDEYEIDSTVINFVKQRFETSQRELDELKKFYPDKYKSWMLSIKEQLDGSSK